TAQSTPKQEQPKASTQWETTLVSITSSKCKPVSFKKSASPVCAASSKHCAPKVKSKEEVIWQSKASSVSNKTKSRTGSHASPAVTPSTFATIPLSNRANGSSRNPVGKISSAANWIACSATCPHFPVGSQSTKAPRHSQRRQSPKASLTDTPQRQAPGVASM